MKEIGEAMLTISVVIMIALGFWAIAYLIVLKCYIVLLLGIVYILWTLLGASLFLRGRK